MAAGIAATSLPGPPNRSPTSFRAETAEFKPGPDVEVVQGNCLPAIRRTTSATQPRGARFGKDFWQAEVTKMIKVYGAPIDERDVSKIVDYLAATY